MKDGSSLLMKPSITPFNSPVGRGSEAGTPGLPSKGREERREERRTAAMCS